MLLKIAGPIVRFSFALCLVFCLCAKSFARDCDLSFTDHWRSVLDLKDATKGIYWDLINSTDERTVAYHREVEKNHPHGSRVIVYRHGKTWYSTYATIQGRDLQADPRGLAIILDNLQAASVFGLEFNDPARWIAPKAKRLQWGVNLVNQILKRRPIPVQFKDSKKSYVSSDIEIMEAWGEHGIVFIGRDGNGFVHDTSLHTAIILTLPELVQLSREQSRHLVRLYRLAEEVDSKYAEVILTFMENLIEDIAKTYDASTGNFGFYFRSAQLHWSNGHKALDKQVLTNLYQEGFHNFTFSGTPMKEFIEIVIANIENSNERHNQVTIFDSGDMRHNVIISGGNDLAERKKAITDFLRSYVENEDHFSKDMQTPIKLSESEFITRLKERRDTIVNAALMVDLKKKLKGQE